MRPETATKLLKSMPKTYDAIAAQFDRSRQNIWNDFVFFEEYIPEDPTILDVGCGNGRLLRYFEGKDIDSYLGVDNSAKLLEKAKKQHKGKRISFRKMDALKLPSTKKYDAVFSMAVLHHIPSRELQRKALLELHKVLDEDGKLFLSVWDLHRFRSFPYFVKAFFKWVFTGGDYSRRDLFIPWGKKNRKMRYCHAFTLNELHSLLKEAGFEIMASERTKKGRFGNHMVVARSFLAPRLTNVMGVNFHKVTLEEATKVIGHFIKSDQQHLVVTPNPEIILHSLKNPKYRDLLNRASLSVADGTGILWASRWLCMGLLGLFRKSELPERVTGVDLMMNVSKFSHQLGAKIFLLGAAPGVADTVAEKWRFDQIVGTYSGSPAKKDEREIVKRVKASGANVLFVAYGAPKQEEWISKNLKKMPNVTVAIGVGGAFDFVAGVRNRAPKWMQKAGIEWLWRVGQEPRRIHRIFRATVVFPVKVLFRKK